MRAKGVTDIHSLSNLTPNVNLDASSPFSGDTSVLSASIRGIGQDDFAFNIDPGVGVYLDGVFLARTIGANQNLLDVDRVEILKGPQGTLFGRNTIGGAINIVTHEPGTEARFQAQATGGSFSRADVGFTADLPITDKLLSTVTASSSQRDGYQDVIPYPAGTLLGDTPWVVDPPNAYPRAGYDQASSYGGQNLQVIRGKVVWHASDAFKLTVTGDYQHQDQPSTPVTILSVNTTPAAIFGYTYNTCISSTASCSECTWWSRSDLCGPMEYHQRRVRPARNGLTGVGRNRRRRARRCRLRQWPGRQFPSVSHSAHLLELCEHADGRHRQDLRQWRELCEE